MVRAFLRANALILAVLLVASTAQAQGANQPPPQEKTELPGEGTEFFRALLHLRDVKPVKENELQNYLSYDDTIVIVLGDVKRRGLGVFKPDAIMRDAMNKGGSVLLATDTNISLTFIDQLNCSISGTLVECADQDSILRHHLEDCPYVVPLDRHGNGRIPDQHAEVRKLFNGDGKDLKRLTHVAAGMPSYIQLAALGRTQPDQYMAPLAKFPPNSFWRNRFGDRQTLSPEAYFAVGGEWNNSLNHPPNRCLVVASDRTFNNAMLYEQDTENLEWTLRVIDYLKGPERQPGKQLKTKCIFIVDGRIVDHFDDLSRLVSRQSQTLPSVNLGALQDKLVDRGNKLIDQLQANDAFNSALNRNVPLPGLMWLFLLLASIAGCWFLFARLIGSRKPTNTPPAPVIVQASSDPPGVFDRRQKELLRRNNVFEPVRDLLREFFASLGIHGEQGPKPPKLNISDVVRKPNSLRLAIDDLWRLAYGPPQVLTVNRWQSIEPYFERIQQAHADGKWAFAFEAWADTKFDD